MNAHTQVLHNETTIPSHDKAMLHLPLDMISTRKGFNPRRYFDLKKMEELIESIQTQGVIQPIVVKPDDDKENSFYLIAGERRFRAANKAGLQSIPVIVRHVSDEEALAMALAENSDRDDVSFAEEAKAVHRMMSLCNGDMDEAALSLGWGKNKLSSRLALLKCSDNTLIALEERKIRLGHAELLAGLDKNMQDQSLAGIIDNNVSVQTLKETIGRYAYKLNDAAFDTTDCETCSHSSSCTSDLFDTSLDNGHCLNRECYDKKTEAFIEDKKTHLSDTYPVIFLDREKPDDTRTRLVREGEQGVGKEQFSACQGCAKFGALMSTLKGSEGEVETGICFDTQCNSKKVKAHLDMQKKPSPPPENTSSGSEKTQIVDKKKKTAKKKAVAETPKKVLDFINTVYFDAAIKTVIENDKLVKIFSLLALVDACKSKAKGSITEQALINAGIPNLRDTMTQDERMHLLAKLDLSTLDDLTTVFAGAMAGENREQEGSYGNSPIKNAKFALLLANTDLADHFTVDQAFLETLTISGLHALLDEAGFIAWYDQKQGENESKKLLKSKRSEQISTIIQSGFEWKGFVPNMIKITTE